jgi:ABC-2 type transport system permease protein
MKYYLKVYTTLLKMNLHNLMAYRMNFINSVVATIAWCSFILISMILLTKNVQTLYGWKREELLLLSGSFNIIIGIFHFFFSPNFERFSRIIDHGELDGLLLKPIDSQFLVSSWHVRYPSFLRILAGVGFNLYILSIIHVPITVQNMLGFAVLTLFSLTILFSIWFLACTTMIWFPRLSNLVDFLFSFNGVGRYPQEMYKEANYFIFLFLLPMTLVLVVPTKALIYKVLFGDIALLSVMAVVLFFLSRRFWKYALKSYTSV